MSSTVFFILLSVGISHSLENVGISHGYHKEVGIPLAAKIRAFEDEVQTGNERIVGGVPVSVNEHPYLGGLLIELEGLENLSVCGSALITSSRLVTAAHCWFDGTYQATKFTVVLGTSYLFSGGVSATTREVATHPQWTPSVRGNDIAIIRLAVAVPLSERIQPIALPNVDELKNTFAGEWAVAAGYGVTRDQETGISFDARVNEVTVQVITETFCRSVYGPSFVTSSTLCTQGAGGVGICRGDTGGPLVTTIDGRRVLIGIGSFVAGVGCQLGYPSAFSRITSFYSFILST